MDDNTQVTETLELSEISVVDSTTSKEVNYRLKDQQLTERVETLENSGGITLNATIIKPEDIDNICQ